MSALSKFVVLVCIGLFLQLLLPISKKRFLSSSKILNKVRNLEPWDVAHVFGLTKVRRPSDWTISKLLSLPIPKSGKQMSYLAEALYFEARGESIQGQLAGEVVLNRVEDPRFPNSICKVINQGTGRRFACQFTYTCDGTET